MAYGVTDVNSGARGGEFLTGNLNYFTIKTIVPCYPTNVKTPIEQALKARNWTSLSASRTITVVDGNGASVTYSDSQNRDYVSAYNKQKNLDTLLAVFGTRANPVVVNVSATKADPTGSTVAFASGGVAAGGFGNANGTSADTGIYTISLVIEKAGSWLVTGTGAGSNDAGYQLLNVLDGVPVLPTTLVTPAGPQDAAAIALSPVGLVFNVVAGAFDGAGANRNTVAKLSDSLPAVA